MKKIFLLIFWFQFLYISAQTKKVAILDFENTSNISEYKSLGKALSNMLITDLANNIHPNKIEFFERLQIKKILKEQELQTTEGFDQEAAVNFGKLCGVDYIFLGSVFIMDGSCNINSRLIDVETSKIILAKDVEGKTEAFLGLKTELAEELAKELNNPITIDTRYKDPLTSLSTLTQYGKVLYYIDQGDLDKAEQFRSVFEETNPEFQYFVDLREEIEKLKKRIEELENISSILSNSFDLGLKALKKEDIQNAKKYLVLYLNSTDKSEYAGNKKLLAYTKLALLNLKMDSVQNALFYLAKAKEIHRFYPEMLELEIVCLQKLQLFNELELKYKILSSLNHMVEIDSFPKEYNCSYIDYNGQKMVSAYRFGTTQIKSGYSPNKLLWHLTYNQSEPGLNKYGLKTKEDDVVCFYTGIYKYGYHANYIDYSIKLNSVLKNWGCDNIPLKNLLVDSKIILNNVSYEMIQAYRTISFPIWWRNTTEISFENGKLILQIKKHPWETKDTYLKLQPIFKSRMNKQLENDLVTEVVIRAI